MEALSTVPKIKVSSAPRREPDSISLIFGDEIDPVVRARMRYSLQMFAAIYGYRFVAPSADAAIICAYGFEGVARPAQSFRIPCRYRTRAITTEAPALKRYQYAGEDFYLIHGLDEATGSPDWLGEIFEWLSSSLEFPIVERDEGDRIPYSATVFHKQGISPMKSYAGIVMAWLQNALSGNSGNETLPRAKSPLNGVDHCVVCSHDIDFCHTKRSKTLVRLSKNLVLAGTEYQSASFLFSNLRMSRDLLAGKSVGDYIPGMLDAIESLGFRSTLFAVAQAKHRRDPNYRIEEVASQLKVAARRGFEIGVHGSYQSVVHGNTLKAESKALQNWTGETPAGSRQHWLRFDRHASLFDAIRDAGLAYDSSLGFVETCGFRNGANFAFPPYDFGQERPYSFLEIPLVLMDGALHHASRRSRSDPQTIATQILHGSRKLGWGGIAVLWHNPLEPIQVPEPINRVFWNLARDRGQHREVWTSGAQFMRAVLTRYQDAGLLKELEINAENAN